MDNVLVVGGSSGLGLEYTKHCLSENKRVVVISRSKMQIPGVTGIACDLANLKKVNKLVDWLENSQTHFDSMLFFQRDRSISNEESWQSEFDVSVSTTRLFLKKAKTLLSSHGQKSIVTVNSLAGTFTTKDASDSYQVSKAALLQLTKYYAWVLGPDGIRVNTVSPFSFAKHSSKEFFETSSRWRDLVENRIPLRRTCTTADIINLINFLVSEKSNYITGQELVIDGGLSLSLGVELN